MIESFGGKVSGITTTFGVYKTSRIEWKKENIKVHTMEIHEKTYKDLLSSGKKGWGGVNFDNRIRYWEQQLDKLFSLIELRDNQVLEFGCGAGDVSIRIAQKGYNVTGIDISPTAINWANQKTQDLLLETRFLTGSVADSTILSGEKFDLIVDGNCLHCLFGDDRTKFFDNVLRLINVNGLVFISSAIILNENDQSPKISNIERCFVTKDSIVTELENRGFILVEEWMSHGTHAHFYGIFKHELNA
jgi:2-polyprenyl-3-methyl-5-hydroxy-6-metoxy-1,4-benzoquinol methylase